MDAIANAVGLGPQILHCVFFKFMLSAEPHVINKTCTDFIALADACKNNKGKTYIKSIEAGADISIEGRAKGFTHGFVVRFASIEDRDYYIKEDPIHLGTGILVRHTLTLGFAAAAKASKLEDIMVFDFVVGKIKSG